MNNNDRHSIFTLLYAVVLIDNRVVKVEVDRFFARIEMFLIQIDYADILTAKSIISTWFVQNYKNILSEMKSPERDAFLLKHVDSLKLYNHRRDVFNIMNEIALADKELHETEEQFLDKVISAWQL